VAISASTGRRTSRKNRADGTTECSAYMDATLPSYPELFEKAWILRPRDGKRAAGFVRTSDLPEKERFELMKDGFRFEE
jgi:hypothetical protein